MPKMPGIHGRKCLEPASTKKAWADLRPSPFSTFSTPHAAGSRAGNRPIAKDDLYKGRAACIAPRPKPRQATIEYMPEVTVRKFEPRWPAALAMLSIGGLYYALP